MPIILKRSEGNFRVSPETLMSHPGFYPEVTLTCCTSFLSPTPISPAS